MTVYNPQAFRFTPEVLRNKDFAKEFRTLFETNYDLWFNLSPTMRLYLLFLSHRPYNSVSKLNRRVGINHSWGLYICQFLQNLHLIITAKIGRSRNVRLSAKGEKFIQSIIADDLH
jgi:predicted transcriptional regulator